MSLFKKSLFKNIILLQTRRIGDLFQTKPLIDNLLEKFNNQCNILIVADDNFKNIQNNFNQNIKLIGKKEFYKYYYNNYIVINEIDNIALFRLNYDNYNNYNKVNNNFNINGGKYCNTYNNEHKYSENNAVFFGVKKINDDVKDVKDNVKIDEIYFDEAINLNFDIINSLILNTIEAKYKYGFTGCGKSDKKKEIICRSKAANFFYNTVRYRNQNKINIVDIFSLIGSGKYYSKNCSFNSLKLKKLLPDLNSNKNNKSEKSQKIKSDKLRFLFAPASSNPKRDWSVEEYAALAGLILKTFKSEIILLGTQKETEIANKIKSYFKINQNNKNNDSNNDVNIGNLDINNANNIINNIIDLTGRTDLNALIDIMQTGDLIISPDTGLLQIASALELDSVSIFLGNANVYETGPYFNGAYTISPIEDCYPCIEHTKCDRDYACKNNIKADDIFNLIKIKLYEKYKSDINKYILYDNNANNNNDNINNNNNINNSDNDDDKNKINYNSYFKCKKLIKEALNKKKFNVYKCDASFSISYAGFFKLKPEKNDLIAEILKYSWINLFVSDINNKISYENAVKNIKKKYLIKSIKKEKENYLNNYKKNKDKNKDKNKYYNNDGHYINNKIEKDFNYIKDIFKNAQKVNDIEDEKTKKYELENFKNFLMNFKENYFEYSVIFDYFIYEFEYILKNKSHNYNSNNNSNNNSNFKYIFDDIIYIIDFGLIILDNLV